MGNIKSETLKGVKWGFIQKLTLKPVQMLYGMVLARLVTPTEMGILGLTAIFFAVAQSLASAGFGAALIRRLDRTEADINTMFWFNLGMSGVLSMALFLLAPWFASYFGQPELLWLTRVSAVMMFLSSSAGVHYTLYQCRRDFKTPAVIGMISTLSGMPICLVLAYFGWGVWALMVQNVTASIVSLALIWWKSPWKPAFMFSQKSFREMFSFGSKLTAAGLLHTIYSELKSFIIGKFYSPAQLGLYVRGQGLSALVPHTIGDVLASIAYPILSTIQNEDARLNRVYRQYVKVTSLVILWSCVILAALAHPAVYVVYGESWVPCAVYIQILSFAYGFDHICTINLGLLKVKGKSGAILKLDIIKKSISVAILIYASTISVEAICWGVVVYTQIAAFINCYYTKSLIGLSWWQQQKDYMSYFLLALVCSLPAWLLTCAPIHPILQLILGGCSSLLLYVAFLYIIKDGAFNLLLSHAVSRFKQRFQSRRTPAAQE
ncbi:MAG: lipopolysaccharide biosynthesis protein [Akkermansia sp.]|nr:lipopolysaccharide biosynthesis protein [Akkermansia sp.]